MGVEVMSISLMSCADGETRFNAIYWTIHRIRACFAYRAEHN